MHRRIANSPSSGRLFLDKNLKGVSADGLGVLCSSLCARRMKLDEGNGTGRFEAIPGVRDGLPLDHEASPLAERRPCGQV